MKRNILKKYRARQLLEEYFQSTEQLYVTGAHLY